MGLRLFHEYAAEGRLVGAVYFLGGGFLELSASHHPQDDGGVALWIQVPDVRQEEQRLVSLGVPIERSSARRPRGLIEMAVRDPDDREVILVEVPEDHFLRRQL